MKFEYSVSRMTNPNDVKRFTSLKEAAEYVGLGRFVLQTRLKGEGTLFVDGWRVDKERISTPNAMERMGRGVLVFTKDGRSFSFGTKSECAVVMGISVSEITSRQMDGMPDGNGNFYDWPLEEDVE